MDNSLIILIFVASIIYKLYSNYKEEMEKAKKRNIKKAPSAPVDNYHPQNGYPAPKPALSIEPTSDSPNKRASTKSNNSILRKVEIDEDLISEKELLRKEPVEFDLRQAVIQSAILERPYK